MFALSRLFFLCLIVAGCSEGTRGGGAARAWWGQQGRRPRLRVSNLSVEGLKNAFIDFVL